MLKYKKRKNDKKTLTQNQQLKIQNLNTNKNNLPYLVGPSFSGKTYFMLKVLSRKLNRDIYIITNSHHDVCTNSKIKIKEIGEEIKLLNEYENGVIVFDDTLRSPNSKFTHQFFIRGRHNNTDIYSLSQSYFD